MGWKISAIFFLLAISALFSSSETALFSLSRSEVARFKASKTRMSKHVIEALSSPRRLLVSIMLGNEVINVGIAILVASLIYELLFGMAWQIKLIFSIAVATPVLVVFGEVIPKNVGIRYSSQLAPVSALLIRVFAAVLSPFQFVLMKLTDVAIRMFGGDPESVRSMIMEEEFKRMVDMGADEGALAEAESELIHHILDLADRKVEDIMTPKEGVFSVALDDNVDSVMGQIRRNQFSRIPVYEANPEDVVGILHTRDLFSVMRRRDVELVRDIENIIRPAYFAKSTSTIEEVLRDFQRLKVHIAVVVDVNRVPVGIVTMEDVFGAIFQGT